MALKLYSVNCEPATVPSGAPYYLFVLWYYDFTIHFLQSKDENISMASVFHQNMITDLDLAQFFKLDCLFRYFLTFPHIGIFRSPDTEKSKNHTLMKYKKKTRNISQQLSYSLICSGSSLV